MGCPGNSSAFFSCLPLWWVLPWCCTLFSGWPSWVQKNWGKMVHDFFIVPPPLHPSTKHMWELSKNKLEKKIDFYKQHWRTPASLQNQCFFYKTPGNVYHVPLQKNSPFWLVGGLDPPFFVEEISRGMQKWFRRIGYIRMDLGVCCPKTAPTHLFAAVMALCLRQETPLRVATLVLLLGLIPTMVKSQKLSPTWVEGS